MTDIEASGCSWTMNFLAPILDPKANDNECSLYIAWTKANLIIIGSIKLHLSDSLKGKYQTQTTNAGLISVLKTEYAAHRISGAFALSKELLDMKVAQSSHPIPSINKVAMLFTHLESAGHKFPENIRAMLLLTKLPPSMNIVAQIIVQAKDASGKAKTPTVEEIQVAVVLSWNQCHIKDTSKAATQANKISAVKHKGDDPKLEQQQQVLQGDGLKKKWKCRKCAGKKQGEKELKDSSFYTHTHIASVVYTSSPAPPMDPVPLSIIPP